MCLVLECGSFVESIVLRRLKSMRHARSRPNVFWLFEKVTFLNKWKSMNDFRSETNIVTFSFHHFLWCEVKKAVEGLNPSLVVLNGHYSQPRKENLQRLGVQLSERMNMGAQLKVSPKTPWASQHCGTEAFEGLLNSSPIMPRG